MLAIEHLKKPKDSGVKWVRAYRETGNDEANIIIAASAYKFDFNLFDIRPPNLRTYYTNLFVQRV